MDLNSVTYSDIMLSSPEEKKKKKKFVTTEQKEAMFSFISDNPEMLTHSSTQENEQVLWKELNKLLNTLQPKKSTVFWKMYWKRWYSSLISKSESSLTILEYKLKKFVNQLEINVVNSKKLTFSEISNKINEIEKEKMELKLEMDEVELKILNYKKELKELENNLKLKRRQTADLLRIKTSLNTKRRKILEKENSTTTY